MDLLQRGINVDLDIRVVTAITTEVVREACRRHQLQGAESIVLGRALTAAALLATLTKNDDERVLLQFRGDGPLGRILADAHGDGSIRGYLGERTAPLDEPRFMGGRCYVGHLVGSSGSLSITRDLGLEQQYQGVVELRTGEVDTDLERYLHESEQLPSILACEIVLDAHGQVYRAAGILCQTFPEADVEALERLRGPIHSEAFTQFLTLERNPEELMQFALQGADFAASSGLHLRFHCSCGPQRARSVVSTLGADDIEELAHEQERTEVKCAFCGENYVLSKDDLLELAAQLRRQRS